MEASSRRGRRRRMNMLSLASCYGLFIGIRFVSFRLCHIFIRYFYSEASSRLRFKFGCTKFLLIIISAAPAILCGMDGVQEVLCIFYTERNFGSVEIPKSICVRTFSMALIMFAMYSHRKFVIWNTYSRPTLLYREIQRIAEIIAEQVIYVRIYPPTFVLILNSICGGEK